MTIHEVIDLFSHEMINEIYHSSADELSKDELVNAVHEVASTVLIFVLITFHPITLISF